ncbi:MAG: Slp family lipoprotein [Gammaproteobacteria bacterium]|nr:Slp family lipoprotein [Gammaproteobacteria bacterium]
MAKLSLAAMGSLMLAACSTTPESLNFEEQNTSFMRVAQAPEAFVGSQVRWGGIVARVENLEQDTLVEIVNLPLDSRARPVANQDTAGRFIARVQGFIDPLIYKQGKEITVVGVLNEPMPGRIGQHEVNFPVVDSTGHHLWEQRQPRVHVTTFSTWDPFWFGHVGYRWRYPYYGYPRYNYCPIHGAFHHHSVRHSVRSHDRQSETQLNAAPTPTNRVQPLSNQTVNVQEAERVTLRDKPQAQTKPLEVRRPEPPKRPTRVHPKIDKVKIPSPTPPRDPRRTEKLR